MKNCIFCGVSKPMDKTVEHIIPKWLIEYTGDPTRSGNFFIERDRIIKNNGSWGGLNQRFPFTKFVFPACKKCNDKYSHLEAKTKDIISKIQDDRGINFDEINYLLDWFDKIRIGLWLGGERNGKETFHNRVEAKFYIDQRIGIKDRGLIIYKIKTDEKKLIFSANTPVFHYYPCCFYILINNLCFINISSDFVFHKNLGFPFISKSEILENNKDTLLEFAEGIYKIKNPIIYGLPNDGIQIYQPINNMLRSGLTKETKKIFYNKKYINGLNKIYISENNFIEELASDGCIKIKEETEINSNILVKKISNFTFDYQKILLLDSKPNNADSDNINFIIKMQDMLINYKVRL